MKEIFININWSWKLFDYYIESYLDIIQKYNLEVFVFAKSFLEEDLKKKKDLENKKIFLQTYNSLEDLEEKIIKLNKNFSIKFINTFVENLIIETNKIKKKLWQEVTKNFELFRNKKLQRELLLNFSKDITVNFLEEKLKNLDFENLKNNFWLPFILKPKDWVESSWVAKIEKIEDFEIYKKNNDLEKEILVEEFIDWEMFTISEYVDEKWNIIYSPLVKNKLGIEINIDDFFIFSRNINKEIQKEIESIKLKNFIYDTIKACEIKNTFIHHEFKLTSSWKLKTIELNWRIWWYRLEMYKEAYNYNLFDWIFNKKCEENLKYNTSSIAIYPEKKSKLISYNYELLEKIKKLKSFYSLRIIPEKYEWKIIWLTKDWFTKVGWIKLKNKDYNQFQKDYNFIEKNYKNLLITE